MKTFKLKKPLISEHKFIQNFFYVKYSLFHFADIFATPCTHEHKHKYIQAVLTFLSTMVLAVYVLEELGIKTFTCSRI